ncbi:MAG TPA: hypothetical protein VGN88_02620, partial [Phycisphaerae bacterium]
MKVIAECSRWLLLALLVLALPGCLSEVSFPMRPERLIRVVNADKLTTRAWTARLHAAAASLLPQGRSEALTTEGLLTNDKPTDVWGYFHLNPAELDTVTKNLHGIEETAQTVSPTPGIHDSFFDRPPWHGFHDVEVPVADDVYLWGRLGIPDKATEIPGSYIIITHGLFGSMDGKDIMNHVEGLRQMGHHVLALEMRGHGQTNAFHPEYAMSFGIFESGDMLAAARWLKSTYHAQHVGLVSFSLTGYEALLAAWLDGTNAETELHGLKMEHLLPVHQDTPAFDLGMFIVSAPVDILALSDDFTAQRSKFQAPVKTTFQEHVHQRLVYYGQPNGFTMWDLAREEFNRGGLKKLYRDFDDSLIELKKFQGFSSDGWNVGVKRMENVRVPLL